VTNWSFFLLRENFEHSKGDLDCFSHLEARSRIRDEKDGTKSTLYSTNLAKIFDTMWIWICNAIENISVFYFIGTNYQDSCGIYFYVCTVMYRNRRQKHRKDDCGSSTSSKEQLNF